MADEIDEEVRKLIEAAHTEAWEILNTHRDTLDALTAELIEHETLQRKDLERLFASVTKRPRITAFNDFGDRTPSDRPPIKTPREVAAERGEPWPPEDERREPARVGAGANGHGPAQNGVGQTGPGSTAPGQNGAGQAPGQNGSPNGLGRSEHPAGRDAVARAAPGPDQGAPGGDACGPRHLGLGHPGRLPHGRVLAAAVVGPAELRRAARVDPGDDAARHLLGRRLAALRPARSGQHGSGRSAAGPDPAALRWGPRAGSTRRRRTGLVRPAQRPENDQPNGGSFTSPGEGAPNPYGDPDGRRPDGRSES